jgi:hypothetical protein
MQKGKVAQMHESKGNGHKANLFYKSHRLLFIIYLSKRSWRNDGLGRELELSSYATPRRMQRFSLALTCEERWYMLVLQYGLLVKIPTRIEKIVGRIDFHKPKASHDLYTLLFVRPLSYI